jgi:hypothetical protein
MNKKNKVLLGAIGLVLLSGIAATSSTFAWFTTVRTASISYSEATVQASDGNLAIEYLSSLNTWMVNQLMMLKPIKLQLLVLTKLLTFLVMVKHFINQYGQPQIKIL